MPKKLDINARINQLNRSKIDEKLPISDWIIKNKIVTEMGKLMEFENHIFLKQPFDDWNQLQVCMKASQIGWSTEAIIKSLWASKMLNYNQIYTLPSERKLWDFQASKTDEIIKRNAVFQSWIGKNASLQKKVGERFINYRGAFNEQDAIALSSDLNWHDEFDRSKPRIVDLYKSRLSASEYRGRYLFSNPSVPKVGVHKYWLLSDQKHWMMKCEKCDAWQFLGWFDTTEDSDYAAEIDLKNKVFKCRKCGDLLPEELRKKGVWIPKRKNAEWSGYWVSQLMAPWIPYKELFHSFETEEEDQFYNFTLGLPTKGAKFQLTKDLLLSKCDPSAENKKDGVIIGVDIGKTLHYVIGTNQGIFEVGTATDLEHIEMLIRKYGARAVIDSEPDVLSVQALQNKLKGRIYLANYHRSRKAKQWIQWGEKKEFGKVSMYRSTAIGTMVNWVRKRDVAFTCFPSDLHNFKDYEKSQDYVSQLESFHQLKEMDSQTGEIYLKWDSGDDDHFGHATIYFVIGLMRGGGKVEVISEDFEKDNKKATAFKRAKEGKKDNWLEQ